MTYCRLLALLTMLSTAIPATGHHGWGHYDTDTPLILSATILEVRWTNPHPQLIIDVSAEAAAPDPASLPVPELLVNLGFEAVADAARPAPDGIWTLDLAPISRLERWGLPRVPKIGDSIQGVGFPSCTEVGVMRPNLIVIDGIGVRQQSVKLPSGCSSDTRSPWLDRLFD